MKSVATRIVLAVLARRLSNENVASPCVAVALARKRDL